MQEPPRTNRRRQDHKPNRLVAHKRTPLRRAPILLGHLFAIRLDARIHHEGSSALSRDGVVRQLHDGVKEGSAQVEWHLVLSIHRILRLQGR